MCSSENFPVDKNECMEAVYVNSHFVGPYIGFDKIEYTFISGLN